MHVCVGSDGHNWTTKTTQRRMVWGRPQIYSEKQYQMLEDIVAQHVAGQTSSPKMLGDLLCPGRAARQKLRDYRERARKVLLGVVLELCSARPRKTAKSGKHVAVLAHIGPILARFTKGGPGVIGNRSTKWRDARACVE